MIRLDTKWGETGCTGDDSPHRLPNPFEKKSTTVGVRLTVSPQHETTTTRSTTRYRRWTRPTHEKMNQKKATVITKKNIDSTLNHLTLKNIFESAGIIDSQKTTRLQTPRGLEVQNTSTYITVESIKARKRRAKT